MEGSEFKKRARILVILKTFGVHLTYSRETGHNQIMKHILKDIKCTLLLSLSLCPVFLLTRFEMEL
jgi:hypothetical protein